MRTTRLQPDRRRAAGSGQGRRAIGSAGVTPHAIETSPAATPLRPRRASRRRATACAAYVLNVKHRRMIRTRGRRSTRVGCAPPGFGRFRRGVFPRLDPGVERADECSRLMEHAWDPMATSDQNLPEGLTAGHRHLLGADQQHRRRGTSPLVRRTRLQPQPRAQGPSRCPRRLPRRGPNRGSGGRHTADGHTHPCPPRHTKAERVPHLGQSCRRWPRPRPLPSEPSQEDRRPARPLRTGCRPPRSSDRATVEPPRAPSETTWFTSSRTDHSAQGVGPPH